ncbi:phosphoribosylformylglycinamidine cyclo-ligase, partial [bacterium]|nr:phosphoribosylformylglycinamidine cyclo-ligase [bacterium]
DLAGFAVGVVDRDAVIDGSMIAEGDAVIGVASSGLHSNGYSLVRKVIFEQLAMTVDDKLPEFRGSVADELLRPTRIYAKTLQNLQKSFALKGIVHITGGGLLENIPRILPKSSKAVLHEGSWERPAIFDFLQREAGIADEEMHRVFNNGLGLVLIVPEAQSEEILGRLEGLGETAWRVGRIERRRDTDASVEIAAS